MIYEVKTLNNKRLFITNPLYVNIRMNKDTPAHYLEIAFLMTKEFKSLQAQTEDEILQVNILNDNGIFVTDMLVDEQKIKCSSSGIIVYLYARSKIALLIDNEARPQEYIRPSLDLMFSKYAEAFGFSKSDRENPVFYGTFEVQRGMSIWSVLKDFSKAVAYNTPKVTLSNEINFNYTPKKSSLVFSNKNNKDSAVKYESIEFSYKRSKRISKVYAKTQKGSDYSSVFTNNRLVNKNITRERYINLVSEKNNENKAVETIRKGENDCTSVKIVCREAVFSEFLNIVKIEDEFIGTIDNLVLAQINYRLDSKGEYSQITLVKNSF